MNHRRTGQPFWRRGDGDLASAARSRAYGDYRHTRSAGCCSGRAGDRNSRRRIVRNPPAVEKVNATGGTEPVVNTASGWRQFVSGFNEALTMAWRALAANKMRTLLTMLGIIIGIASVIAIVSIGEGTKNQMNSEIDGIGGGQIAVSVSNDAITESEFITAEDVQAVREIDTVEGVNVSESYDGETVTGKGNFSIMLTAEGRMQN